MEAAEGQPNAKPSEVYGMSASLASHYVVALTKSFLYRFEVAGPSETGGAPVDSPGYTARRSMASVVGRYINSLTDAVFAELTAYSARVMEKVSGGDVAKPQDAEIAQRIAQEEP